jgi:SAM-dependent methyltransferase
VADWAQGYVSDIPYSLGFFRELTPANLGFATIAVGRSSHGAAAPQRVLELGFGRGLSINVLAAANPGTMFEGVDFIPEHVLEARALAERAGLKNLAVREASFEDVAAEARENQHDLDLIILHGILSWVGPSAQQAVVEVARKRLKPGGLLYASYNCMPGLAPIMPLQRLMRDYARRIHHRSDKQMVAAMQLASDLAGEGARYFAVNQSVTQRLQRISNMDRNYLVHEYLHSYWNIFYFPDVAELFAPAKLEYMGSAALNENIDQVTVPEKIRGRLAEIDDVVFREFLRDYAANRGFRRDIFARGAVRLNAIEQNAALGKVRFALGIPHSRLKLDFQTLLGELKGTPEIYQPIARLLADKIASFDEIAALPELKSQGRAGVLVCLALLVHSFQVIPILSADSVDKAPAQRFNRAVAAEFKLGRAYSTLAAPIGGTGLPASQAELLALVAYVDKKAGTVAQAAKYGFSILTKLGTRPVKEGKPVADDNEAIAALESQMAFVFAEILPIWRRLGVVN